MQQTRTSRVVLITGASSGIGAATGRELARRGDAVVLMARRGDRLEALAGEIEAAGGRALAVAGDVTQADDRARVLRRIDETFGRLDVLINNAGGARASLTENAAEEDIRLMFELNVIAPIELTQLALPALRASRGLILNVASLAAKVSTPPVGIYSATKFALAGWSEALRRELIGSGVRVTVVNPGPIRTEFADVAGIGNAAFMQVTVPPERVALAIARMVERPRREIAVPSFLGPAGFLGSTWPAAIDAAYRLVARIRPDLLTMGVSMGKTGTQQSTAERHTQSAAAPAPGTL